jgi:hypothetical protein
MVNQFLNAAEYANVMLLLLKNQLVFGRLVDGQFKDQVTDENGLVINVKAPPRFVATSGATLQSQDLVVGSSPVQVDQYKNVHISVGDLEYVQSYNALMQNETMKSAASTLAHDVDKFLALKTLGFQNWIAGTASGTRSANAQDPSKMIASPNQAFAAHTRLMQRGVPNSDLSAVVGFDDGQAIRGSLLSDFTPDVNRTALERVRIPLISEIDWYATQQLPTLSTGTRTQGDGSTTGGTMNGANQNVNYRSVKGGAGAAARMQQTIAITGAGASGTIAAGEVFTIQNVFAWDWRMNQALPDLAQFTVVSAVTLNGSGAATITITPAIIVQGSNDGVNTYANTAFATVDSIPASGAFIRFVGTAATNFSVRSAFHKRAISLVSARLQMPFTGVASFATDPDTGIAIRYWRGSDITTGQHIHRWDMIYGAAVLDSDLGVRVCGT